MKARAAEMHKKHINKRMEKKQVRQQMYQNHEPDDYAEMERIDRLNLLESRREQALYFRGAESNDDDDELP